MPHLTATRHLGATGISVLLIGYGTAPLGKEKTMPRAEAVRCLHHAIDAGITDLDTSPDYAKESQEGKSALFWLHDTAVMGWQQRDEPALVAY